MDLYIWACMYNEKLNVCNVMSDLSRQLQNEILELKLKLQEKEKELAEVKEQLGITAYTEFKDSLSHGWKVLGDKWGEVKESERYVHLWMYIRTSLGRTLGDPQNLFSLSEVLPLVLVIRSYS